MSPPPSRRTHAPLVRSSRWLRLLLPFALLIAAACGGGDEDAPASGDDDPSASGSNGGGGQDSAELADAYWQPPVTVDDGIAVPR